MARMSGVTTSRWAGFACSILLGLAGCAGRSVSVQFYLLQPLSTTAVRAPAPHAHPRWIGVGPIRFPDYLSRPQMVVEAGGGRYVLSERHRWAERLDDNFTRVLAENLARLLPRDQVVVFPWPRGEKPDWTVGAEVVEFNADPSGGVRLIVRWALKQTDQVRVARRTSYTAGAVAGDYDSMARAHSEALQQFSRELAGWLTAPSR